MCEKILTISVAAYNVEKYIRQTMESLADEDIINDIEVFVIDDGGTDNTLGIVQEYANKYPHSIFAVHKENEGYGSTIQYSITHANGKYFRLLDGDDCFNKDELTNFIIKLKQLDTDIVITSLFNFDDTGITKIENVLGKNKVNEVMEIPDIEPNCIYGMWAITYKTELLKKINMEFPPKCLYTDQIYSTIPFAYARTIYFTKMTIYCYRIDRDGQSITKESRIKHIDDNNKVCNILYEFYEKEKNLQNENINYILLRVATYARHTVKTYLLEPMSMRVMKEIEEYDKKLKTISPDIYNMLADKIVGRKFSLYIRFLRITHYSWLSLLISKIIVPN